jgi:hypothetical protein
MSTDLDYTSFLLIVNCCIKVSAKIYFGSLNTLQTQSSLKDKMGKDVYLFPFQKF